MNARNILAAAATIALTLSLPAQAAEGDDLLNRTVREYNAHQARGVWVNPYLPAARQASADEQLHAIVAGLTRAQLDRGGWVNPHVAADHDAAGARLLAAAIGSGVTSGGATAAAPTRLLAAR